jgi:tetratricopeptide (TPR) repeat protein
MEMGRYEEAIATYRALLAANAQDDARTWLGVIFLYLRSYDAALDVLGQTSPKLTAYVHLARGEYQRAIAALEQSVGAQANDFEAHGALSLAYQRSGDAARSLAHYLEGQRLVAAKSEIDRACFEAVSGHVEEALPLLEIALAKHQTARGWARHDPEFTFIKHDPRFLALVTLPTPIPPG